MSRLRRGETGVWGLRLARGSLLAVLAVASQVGCTREFFREWCNMDVSEAIFEKSRDPRWRLDLFSVEPPPLSRFANPYDPEVPPAPPDDQATEALSPVPQWPDNRLLIPVEGTGYLDLLEYWQRQEEGKQEFEGGPAGPAAPTNQPGGFGFGNGSQPPSAPTTAPPPPPGNSPFTRPPAPNAPPNAGPDMRGPQATSPGPKPGGSAGPSETVIRMQDSPVSPGPAIFGVRQRVAEQSSTNPGTNAAASTPITLRNTKGPAGRPKIPPPKPGDTLAVRTRRPEQTISIPPPRSADSIAAGRPRSQSWSIPRPRPASDFLYVEPLRVKVVQDRSVSQASMRNSAAQAPPGPAQDVAQPQPPGADVDQPVPRLQPRPPVGAEQPTPGGMDPNVQGPPLPPQLIEEAGRMSPAEAQGLASVLVASVPKMDEAEAMGLPRGYRAYKVGMAQAWLLALMNSRFYQFNLEQLYLTALPVTLQRFLFEPQFYAGLSPQTAPGIIGALGEPGGGFPSTPGVSTANTFNYQTRFAPTGQLSTLNIGTVAGFGKVFSTGGQLLMGFANEVAFNFLGKNPQTPTVFSALPISFVQPFLKGGGRALILEPLTTAERNLLYQVRLFALFRQQFFVVLLTAGTVQNFGNTFALAGFSASISGNNDPTIGFIPAVQNIAQVEIDRRNVAFYENLVTLYTELIQGEASGLTQLQVNQVMSSLIGARQTLFNDKITYRSSCDQFKMQMGLPPDTPIVLDQHLYQPFFDVFDGVDGWQKDPRRTLDQLPGIIAKFPVLEDIDVEGRSVLGLYRNYEATRRIFKPEDEDPLEDELQAAVRIALEYRLDLMNSRAQLYDAWRQIRVTANGLLGVFNVAITNNIYTPPGNTNPFAFLSEAKQFALTLQAELPLVRVSERNNFRTAIINYERARRSLQNTEDNLKIQLRNDLRTVHVQYIAYEINKRVFELNVRLKDQSFEQIVAPPAGGTQALAQVASAATQTTNLLNFQRSAYMSMIAMTTGYQAYEQARLIVYRDIGTLPYDEWEAFSELFPSEYHGPLIGQSAIGGPRGFTPPAEAIYATPASR